MPEPVTQERIEELRSGLTEKLGELHRRAVHTRRVLSPSTYLSSPWLKVGIAAAIGLAIGSRRARRVLPAGAEMPLAEPPHESVLHAIVRAGLSAAAAAIVTRMLTDGDEDSEGETDDESDGDESDDEAGDAQG